MTIAERCIQDEHWRIRGHEDTEEGVSLNAIQFKIVFSTQHIVNTTIFSCIRRVEKGASSTVQYNISEHIVL